MIWGLVASLAGSLLSGMMSGKNKNKSGGTSAGNFYPGGYFPRDQSVSMMMGDWYDKFSGATMNNNQLRRQAENNWAEAAKKAANYQNLADNALDKNEKKKYQALADEQYAEVQTQKSLANNPVFHQRGYEDVTRDYNKRISGNLTDLQKALTDQPYGQEYRSTITDLIKNPNATGIGLPETGYQGLLDRLSKPSVIGFGDDPNAFSFIAPGNAAALNSTYQARGNLLNQLAGLADKRAQSGYDEITAPAGLGIKASMEYSPENAYYSYMNRLQPMWQNPELMRYASPAQPMMAGATANPTTTPGTGFSDLLTGAKGGLDLFNLLRGSLNSGSSASGGYNGWGGFGIASQ